MQIHLTLPALQLNANLTRQRRSYNDRLLHSRGLIVLKGIPKELVPSFVGVVKPLEFAETAGAAVRWLR